MCEVSLPQASPGSTASTRPFTPAAVCGVCCVYVCVGVWKQGGGVGEHDSRGLREILREGMRVGG